MTALARRILLAPLAGMSSLTVVAAACDDTTTPSAPLDAGADSPSEITDASVSSDGEPMCDLHGKFGSPECERCIAAKCCDKVTACANDPSCAAMQSCALGCLLLTDSSGCYSQCVPKYPD